MASGTVSRVCVDRGFGFIARPNGEPDVFFHFRDLAESLAFDEALQEMRVVFDAEQTDKGWRARNVRPAD